MNTRYKLIITGLTLCVGSFAFSQYNTNVCVTTTRDGRMESYCTSFRPLEVTERAHLARMERANRVVWDYSTEIAGRGGNEDFTTWGSYDACLEIATKDAAGKVEYISDEHPIEVQDACALVLFGGEY